MLSVIVWFLNFLLGVFGRYPDGERRAWLYLVGRDKDEKWRPEGRLVLRVGRNLSFRTEWNLWTHFCMAEVTTDPMEGALTLHLGLPPVALWFSVEHRSLWKLGREALGLGVSVHDWRVWWRLLTPVDSWSSKTPRWREGNWDVLKTLLGDVEYSSRVLSTCSVLVPMPEGAYPGTVTLTEDSWSRPRWPTTKLRRAKIDVPKGVPHMGKGENSWDCGQDATYGLSTTARTVDEAVSKFVASVLRSRARYDGDAMAVYPPPNCA